MAERIDVPRILFSQVANFNERHVGFPPERGRLARHEFGRADFLALPRYLAS